MLPFSHLGIGGMMAKPFSKRLPLKWLLLGTLLPDLIDKPIFFGMGIIAYLDHHGWVRGKRGVAHSLLFLVILTAISKWTWGSTASATGNAAALLWPFLG
jgi:membrane-bound metal-dependent hydrolase YbcI (DUF457 family)